MLCWYKQQHCLRHKQGGTTFQTKHYRQQISGTKWGGGKEEEWRRSDWVSSPLSLLPALTWPVSLLTKQPAWSQSSESPPRPPPNPSLASRLPSTRSGTLALCGFPVCLVEDLAVSLPGGALGGREGRERGREGEKDRGEVGGRRQRERHPSTPELGLIYFINRDYKFNLQTRGQNFSLTRGPWRTSGPGDHSYY